MNTDDLTETSQNFRDKAQQATEAMRQNLAEWQRKATENARRAAEFTDNYVHENPWPVIGGVALGCFILGLLVGRSRD